MKNFTLSFTLFLLVLSANIQAQPYSNEVKTSTNYEVAGDTVQVTMSTVNVNIPGKLNYTFQVYFGDGFYAAANVPLYSNDTTFTTTHTYLSSGTYTITYILGYADLENAGPAGLELTQTSTTIEVGVGAVATGVTNVTPVPATTIYCYNKQLIVKSDVEIAELRIFNTAGQEVQSLLPKVSGTLNIPLSATLTPGIYIVAVKGSDNQTLTKKIMVD